MTSARFWRFASDEDLWARQAALQTEAAAILADLNLTTIVADIGPMLLTGSYVSGLMCWPDLDIMVFAGVDFSPQDVLCLLQRIVDRPGIVGFDYRDERGPRSPTGTARDERYHVVIELARNLQTWRIDLTLWLNDPHANVTAWHESLRDSVTADQRNAILRIKDVWYRLPSYPERIGGLRIYSAVLDDGVRTPQAREGHESSSISAEANRSGLRPNPALLGHRVGTVTPAGSPVPGTSPSLVRNATCAHSAVFGCVTVRSSSITFGTLEGLREAERSSVRPAVGSGMTTSQVFVSHTSDMARFPPGRSFVQAVLDAVNRAELAAVDMGYFAAREGHPADYCQQRVRDCEIYLAVVGFRYGSLVPGESVSYTELEFIEATVAVKPRLVFLLDEAADLPAHLVDTDRAAVDTFRQRLRDAGLICATFSTAAELQLAVFHALKELAGAGRVVPRQLPAAVAHFAGRTDELATLTGLLHGRTEMGGTVVISTIGGTAGVGKTALAVHWAHRVAERFPDGQLYVDLRGFSPGQAVAPGEVVRRFLDALEVPPERIPVDLDAQAALYRSQLAGRRMLVVLDNARDSAQVRPLLPAAATCLVLVTSRNQLTGLVATDGAHPVDLDLLSPAEARELLAQRLGTQRVAAEPDAVAELIARCARLPLALALVAARAATRPNVALHALAGELRDAQQRWDTLTGDDPATDVRAVFSWSYHALTPPAAHLFRLLGLHPGPDITAPAAASLAGITPGAVRPVLAELTRASLLAEPTTGRYAYHDLLRDYASHLADTTDTDEQRHTATGRLLDHYLHTAHPANLLLDPATDPVPLPPPRAGVTPEQLSDHAQAVDWFTAQRPVLLAAVEHAAATGFDTHTWQLAWTLRNFLDRRGHWHDWVAVGRAAVAAAQRLADATTQARTHRTLASAHTLLGRLDDAHTHLRHALDLATRTGDQTQQAQTHHSLARLSERQAQPAQALHHAQQALQLFQATDNQSGQAYALNTIGWYHALLGEHQQALTYCQQALTRFQQLGNRGGQAGTWDSLGYAHHHLGQHTQALTCYQHAITLVRDLGDRYNEATVLTHLGDTHQAAGNPQAARDAWQQALIILNDLDHPDTEPVHAKLARLDTPTNDAAP